MESSRKNKILMITVDAAVSVNHSTQNKNTKKTFGQRSSYY